MKFLYTPTPSTIIEVSKSEVERLQNRCGLWLKYDEKSYYWLVQHTWILVMVEDP